MSFNCKQSYICMIIIINFILPLVLRNFQLDSLFSLQFIIIWLKRKHANLNELYIL